MTYEIEAIRQLIWRLKWEQKQAMLELAKMPSGRLYQEKFGERIFYYRRLVNGHKIIRRGITKNSKLVYQLARKEFLLKNIKGQETRLKCIKLLSTELDFCAWQKILKSVADKFPAIPPEVFLLGDQYDPNPIKRSTMFLEGTIHRTKRGVMVRSKSELFIADMLESLGIPYQYEVDLPYDDYHLCPDFTVIRPRDGKVLFWEHFGMTHDEEYLRKMDLKLDKYRNMGVVPWDNLIISYDKADGSLDVSLIRALVEGWLK